MVGNTAAAMWYGLVGRLVVWLFGWWRPETNRPVSIPGEGHANITGSWIRVFSRLRGEACPSAMRNSRMSERSMWKRKIHADMHMYSISGYVGMYWPSEDIVDSRKFMRII